MKEYLHTNAKIQNGKRKNMKDVLTQTPRLDAEAAK
jgi:hypothetical protein